MENEWKHPVDFNTLCAINKSGLRKFYEYLLDRGDGGFDLAIARLREENQLMFEDLKRQVKENGEVISSALTLIQGLKDQIAGNIYNPEELKSIVSELEAQELSLAGAVAANIKPVEPTPPVEEVKSVDPEPMPTEPVVPVEDIPAPPVE
jgi:hypothetical protein